jgi:putative transposase
VRRDERKRMPYESPRGRRLHVLAITATRGAEAELHWLPSREPLDAVALLHSLFELPPAPVPTVVVLDNIGFHRGALVRAWRAALHQCGVYLYYLPPYSPELNAIERLFRTIKHHELPERRYASLDALEAAVIAAFERQEAKLHDQSARHPGLAA